MQATFKAGTGHVKPSFLFSLQAFTDPMNAIKTVFRYLSYYFRSNTLHGTHSPFVYKLLEDVVYDRALYPEYNETEEERKHLLQDQRMIRITDYGAGAGINHDKERKVASIAARSLKPKKYARLLFRLVRHFKPRHMIELGTSLGITSSYLSKANPQVTLVTMEGCPNTLAVAKESFMRQGLKNIQTITGNFDHTFTELIDRMETVDFIFFDGNHRKEATLDYFYKALPKANERTLFVFDDIYWSDGMAEAWQEIKANANVRVTIDLFFIGLVFFKKDQAKEDFMIRY